MLSCRAQKKWWLPFAKIAVATTMHLGTLNWILSHEIAIDHKTSRDLCSRAWANVCISLLYLQFGKEVCEPALPGRVSRTLHRRALGLLHFTLTLYFRLHLYVARPVASTAALAEHRIFRVLGVHQPPRHDLYGHHSPSSAQHPGKRSAEATGDCPNIRGRRTSTSGAPGATWRATPRWRLPS